MNELHKFLHEYQTDGSKRDELLFNVIASLTYIIENQQEEIADLKSSVRDLR